MQQQILEQADGTPEPSPDRNWLTPVPSCRWKEPQPIPNPYLSQQKISRGQHRNENQDRYELGCLCPNVHGPNRKNSTSGEDVCGPFCQNQRQEARRASQEDDRSRWTKTSARTVSHGKRRRANLCRSRQRAEL